MSLNYTNLRNVYGQYEYERHGKPIKIYGGKLVENIIQALARIVITDQILTTHQLPGVDVVLTVHDEIIALSSKEKPDETLDKILAIMKKPPVWCSNLPLDAEGHFSNVYSK